MMNHPTTSSATARPAVAELGSLQNMLGHALRRAQTAIAQEFQHVLEPEGIRPIQYSVLEVLRANPSPRQTLVCTALGIKTTNFVPLFDELEKRGLAERRAAPHDRRAKCLVLTEAGRAMLTRLEPLVAEHEARFEARLGRDGKAQLLGLLSRATDPAFDRRDTAPRKD
jgi:DNA-binding MarR family transcriptional regulator